MKIKVISICCLLFFSGMTWALPKAVLSSAMDRRPLMTNPSWEQFQRHMKEQKEIEEREGFSYILSGGIAFIGGIVGYHNSKDVFAKGAYALSQSLGVAAIGYGAYLGQLGHEDHLFHQTLASDRQLNLVQKDHLVQIYFRLDGERKKESQKVAALTHGLLAALNLYNASTAPQEDLRSSLYFISAINFLASVSYSF